MVNAEELCANCGKTYDVHLNNLGMVWPCWKPSGLSRQTVTEIRPIPKQGVPIMASKRSPIHFTGCPSTYGGDGKCTCYPSSKVPATPSTSEGAQSNPSEALPEITERHAAVLDWIESGGPAPFSAEICYDLNTEYNKVLRALASGTHGTYDRRTQRVVEVAELEAMQKTLADVGYWEGDNGLETVAIMHSDVTEWIRGNE